MKPCKISMKIRSEECDTPPPESTSLQIGVDKVVYPTGQEVF